MKETFFIIDSLHRNEESGILHREMVGRSRREQERSGGGRVTAFIGFSTEKLGQAEKLPALDSLGNSSRDGGVGDDPGCMVAGPGLIWKRGNTGLLCENWLKEVIESIGSQLVCLYVNDGLTLSCLLPLEIN